MRFGLTFQECLAPRWKVFFFPSTSYTNEKKNMLFTFSGRKSDRKGSVIPCLSYELGDSGFDFQPSLNVAI